MPDLAGLPPNTAVFIDTNIFLLHYHAKSASCSALLARVARGEIKAYGNSQVLSDLLHKLMLTEALSKGLIRRQRAVELKNALQADRIVATRLTDYQMQFEQTLQIGLKVVRISKRILIQTKTERTAHGLMTGDSLHLGTMNHHSSPLRNIATHDGDFEHIDSLVVWKPMDVVP